MLAAQVKEKVPAKPRMSEDALSALLAAVPDAR